MPVRKIPKNYAGVTGSYSSRKNADMAGFESLLERDYFLLLDFDPAVESFEPQPVRIPVPGVPRGYVPDVLVKYFPARDGTRQRPLLAEIKHSNDLARNADKYAKKFEEARRYAQAQDWEFRVVDERAIRTPRLANLKFLREYRNVDPDEANTRRLLSFMAAAGGCNTSTALLQGIAADEEDLLQLLPTLWAMVLRGHLLADLDIQFGQTVALRLPETAP